VPICRPENPRFASAAERQVWELLRGQLRKTDVLLSGIRVTDRKKDHEADLVVLMPDAGAVVVEIKGGSVWRDGGRWRTTRQGSEVTIDPVGQARDVRYALREYVESDPRWTADGRSRVRWAHAVVLPNTELQADFSCPDAPRWMVADRGNVGALATFLRDIPTRQETKARCLTSDDADIILEALAGRGQSQRDVVADAKERELDSQRLTEEQAMLLGAIRLLHRVEVRGGAGSGKTWLAIQQARRLTGSGKRVALLCYSRGLAAYLNRFMLTVPKRERPAYVGEFHSLGHAWGAAPGSDQDSDYWEQRLPEQMQALAAALPSASKFDAVIIDEAQDFADAWWPAVLASLRDEEAGGLYVFSDEGQRVFSRFGQPPVPLVPLMLDHNLRNTRQIAGTFNSLAPMKMRLIGGDGPAVRFSECQPGEALSAGDDAVDQLLNEGWNPDDIALLTTGSRHPEQVQRQAVSQDEYWSSFWDTDQVFYGHVLGFKGLERRAVVLVLNENALGDRSRERLYVGLSRARDQLIVCGSRKDIRQLGGDAVLRHITGEA
jgi:ATP:corrinoid adenosyltransferase